MEHVMAEAQAEKANRRDKVAVGIVGEPMQEAERDIPPNHPPAWPPNEKLSVVGKPTKRIDGRHKVTGAAKYTADINLPGMLFARMVVSPHPAATITSIDTSEAEKHPKVKAVHILERDLSATRETTAPGDKPSYPTIRYVGQPIAAVAAVTQADADEAARLIKVEYEIKPFVVDIERARKEDSPLVYAGQ